MIKWHELLFSDDKAKESKAEIIKAVKNEESVCGLYIVALSSNPNEQLDIFEYSMFKRELRFHEDKTVVGLAFGKANATKLVCEIAKEAYKKTGNYYIRELFL